MSDKDWIAEEDGWISTETMIGGTSCEGTSREGARPIREGSGG